MPDEETVSTVALLLLANMNMQLEEGQLIRAKDTARRLLDSARPFRTQGEADENWANAVSVIAEAVLEIPML